MSYSESELAALLLSAHQGDEQALGMLLAFIRPQLTELAKRSLSDDVAARTSGSDVVQQTCLSAVRAFDRFEGNDIAQFIAWVRKLHENNIRNIIRDHTVAEKRQVSREIPGIVEGLQGRTTTPSQWMLQLELEKKLEACLNQLPPEQHEAVVLRYRREMSLRGMAETMQRSEAAVAGLLKRGLAKLRETLNGPPTDSESR